MLGSEGAGGIGVALDGAINVSQWREVAAVLALALVAVLLTEPMVASLRTRGM